MQRTFHLDIVTVFEMYFFLSENKVTYFFCWKKFVKPKTSGEDTQKNVQKSPMFFFQKIDKNSRKSIFSHQAISPTTPNIVQGKVNGDAFLGQLDLHIYTFFVEKNKQP
jgi:hypothetical protein